MSVISWGKPKIEIARCDSATGNLPVNPEWTQIDTPVDGTSQLETTDGDKTEALEEGGAVVDTYQKKSKFTFSFELYQKKGYQKPIEDSDGVITDNYAVRLTPEDPACTGFIIKKASVAAQTAWNSSDGGRWKYTFDALQPSSGDMLEEFVSEGGVEEPVITDGAESITLPATAGSVNRVYSTSNGAGVSASVEDGVDWLSVSVSGNKVTFTRTAYASTDEGANPRTATVTVGIPGTSSTKSVTVSQTKAQS